MNNNWLSPAKLKNTFCHKKLYEKKLSDYGVVGIDLVFLITFSKKKKIKSII